jgi:dCTP deaminase
MSTIVDHQILRLVEADQMIQGFRHEQLNPASYDVRLGAGIQIEGKVVGPKQMRERWHPYSLDDSPYYMAPGEFILGVTEEYIRVPTDMEAVFQLKSSRGREGYEHALAGYIDPGFHGQVTLELSNLNQRHYLPLVKGMLIGQLRFMKLDSVPTRSYSETGHYHGDIGAQPSKVSVLDALPDLGYGD